MTRLPYLRVLIDPSPSSGEWNMAVDQTLLETAIESGLATLRWYEWIEPTISLGYFQREEMLNPGTEISQRPRVRRLSGGGAILHDNETTYSVALPSSQQLFVQPQDLYDIVHEAISQELCRLGFPVAVRGESVKLADEPFLCFQRRDSHDVVLKGHKVLGSAQRRRRGAILQHGSLIRGASDLAKHLPGLSNLVDCPTPADLPQRLNTCVADSLAESWRIESLTQTEITRIQRICHSKSGGAAIQ